MMRRLLLLSVLTLGAVGVASAQLATVRGRVLSADDEQPLQGATVVLESEDGDRQGTATNAGGLFLVGRLTPGRYVATVSFVGFVPHTDTLQLGFDDQRTLTVALEPDAEQLDEVVVEDDRTGAGTRGGAGLVTVRPSQLARLPSPDLSADMMSYLLTRPGVVTVGDQGGQLFVRGGTPTQNLVLLDGIPIYQPFHIVGFFSVLPADLISYADVYAGGFGARYGGRIASVIDVNLRNGNKQRVAGSASVAPFLSTVRLEVPVVPGQASLMVSARESVLERLAAEVVPDPLPYRFGDRLAKFHAFLSPTSHLSLLALRTFDEGNLSGTTDLGRRIRWTNEAYGGRYFYLSPSFPVLTELAVNLSAMTMQDGPPGAPTRTAEVDGFNAEINFAYLLGAVETHFGLFGRSTRFAFNLEGGPLDEEVEHVAEGGFYLTTAWTASDALRLEPGLRLHSFPSRSQLFLEPRLRVAYRPGGVRGTMEWNAAWGIYHQQIVGLSNDRDVTDVFTAWSPSPQRTDVPRAMHVIGGVRAQVRPWLHVTAEAYHKRLDHLAFPELGTVLARGPVAFDPVHGRTDGLDIGLQVARGGAYAEVNYGLASVWYDTGATRFRPPHDRRHHLNVLGRLTRGRLALSGHWQFGSGLPFTPSNGIINVVPLDASTDFHTDPGDAVVSYGAPYESRLPAYHRLDLSAAYTIALGRVHGTLQAGAVNVYDRANLFDVDFFSGRRVDQLPFIPTLGLKVEVR